MKIQREGKEYELTTEELLRAYREQEKIFRLEDVIQHVNDFHEWECEDSCGIIITDHLQKEFLSNKDLQELVLAKYDANFDCDCSENNMWEDAITEVVAEQEISCTDSVLTAIDEMLESETITAEEHVAMRVCKRLIEKAVAMVYREDRDVMEVLGELKEGFILLRHEGTDSHSRPVYSMADGRLVVDCDNRRCVTGFKLCTKLDNAFDGEPDTPLYLLYQDAYFGFYPDRFVRG